MVGHSTDWIETRGSLYGGRHVDGQADYATIETHLESTNSGPAEIRIALRHFEYPGANQVYNHEALKLTLDDARELVRVVAFLVERAEQAAPG